MNATAFMKTAMSEAFFNRFFYYYLHLRGGRIPKRLDLKTPTTFNEKTIWLKMNHRQPNANVLVDKVRVKEHVRNIIGPQYLIPNIAVYESAAEVDFAVLPDAFVLKANHGSGWNIICPRKVELDVALAKKRLDGWLRTNYFDIGKEYQYRDVAPRILCEAYLENTAESPLLDYKIFCFSGRPRFIQVDFDRFTNHTRGFYDLNWERLPFTTLYPMSTRQALRPDALGEMLSIAETLAKGLIFARIDLYYHNGKIYFGEVTFHHGGGFEPFLPQEYDELCGQFLALPA
jgi:hypothetical protein